MIFSTGSISNDNLLDDVHFSDSLLSGSLLYTGDSYPVLTIYWYNVLICVEELDAGFLELYNQVKVNILFVVL